MASFTSKATGNWEAEGQTTWNEAGHPQAGDDVTIQNTHVVTQTQNEACAGLVIDSGGTLDMATYNLANSSTTDITGTLQIGTSADAGLTTTGVTFNSGSTRNWQQGSVINCAGNWTEPNANISTNNYRGKVTISDDCTMTKQRTDNRFWEFTLDATKTITVVNGFQVTAFDSNATTINGTVAGTTYGIGFGCNDTGSITIGANADFTGTGFLKINCKYGATFTNNRASAFSYAGHVQHGREAAIDVVIPAWDWSNSEIEVEAYNAGNVDRYITNGTLKCTNFMITTFSGYSTTLKNSTTNPSFEISGYVDCNDGDGTAIIEKGTGTITLVTGTAATKSIDFAGLTVEDIIVNSSDDTDIKQITANVTTDSLTITDGKLDMQTYNLTSTGATDITGILVIGTSAGTGLTTAGLTFNAGATADLQTTSNVNNSGAYSCDNSTIWSNNNRGAYVQTGSGNYISLNANNRWYEFTLNESQTLTLTGKAQITNQLSNATTINGTLAAGVYYVYLGGATVIFGASSDVTGNGILTYYQQAGDTQTISRASAFSYTGDLIISAIANPAILSGDWRNANITITGGTSARTFIYLNATDGRYNDFTIAQDNNFDVEVSLSATNNDLYLYGDVDLHTGAGTYTTNWTKGTGTITLPTSTAATHTYAFDGKTIEDLVINSTDDTDIKQITENVTVDTLTITDGKLDLQTYNLTSTGATSVTGILKMGTSSDTGLTTAGLTFNSGATRDWQVGSIINCAGNWIEPDEDISTNNNRGNVTITGSGNMAKPNANNRFEYFTLDAGITLTLTDDAQITNIYSQDNTINGTIAIGANTLYLGCSATGSIVMGANSDLTGAGTLQIASLYGCTFTNNRATAYSFTGEIDNVVVDIADMVMPAWDFSNATLYKIRNSTTADHDRYISAGTLKCQDLEVYAYTGYSTTIRDDVTNPSFQISGGFDLSSVGTVVWTKGTGTITLSGSSATIDANGQSIEDIIVNSSGTKSFSADVTTDSYTHTLGIVDGAGNITTGDVTLTAGTFSNTGSLTASGDVAIAAGFTEVTAGTIVMTGTSKALTTNDKTIEDLDIDTGASVTTTGDMLLDDLIVDGTLTLDKTASHFLGGNVSGGGTLASPDAMIIFVFYDGTDTFVGTLTNVVLVSNRNVERGGESLTGLGLNRDMTL